MCTAVVLKSGQSVKISAGVGFARNGWMQDLLETTAIIQCMHTYQ